ncbi:hypothetical protein [Bowmanella sp. JS7-9]|uniref:Uncharacterized protein n=1 Tax=Pseudobowmanella zhangzhouensis TaxID=1537679 RepID=A0ABW1XKQ1_9ALTE|nr:hypothetical protein [Bowmanella sp. JS7-9]TBX20556.1 hypothetical protein TK45_14675 [Bowmanella sp. JS7-9]
MFKQSFTSILVAGMGILSVSAHSQEVTVNTLTQQVISEAVDALESQLQQRLEHSLDNFFSELPTELPIKDGEVVTSEVDIEASDADDQTAMLRIE